MTRHCFQVASSCILPSIMCTPRPSGIASMTFLANSTSSAGGEKTFLAMSIWTGCSDHARDRVVPRVLLRALAPPAVVGGVIDDAVTGMAAADARRLHPARRREVG